MLTRPPVRVKMLHPIYHHQVRGSYSSNWIYPLTQLFCYKNKIWLWAILTLQQQFRVRRRKTHPKHTYTTLQTIEKTCALLESPVSSTSSAYSKPDRFLWENINAAILKWAQSFFHKHLDDKFKEERCKMVILANAISRENRPKQEVRFSC